MEDRMNPDITISFKVSALQLARLTRIPSTVIKQNAEHINNYFTEFFLNEDHTKLILTEHVDLLTQAVMETCSEGDKEYMVGVIESLFGAKNLRDKHPPEIVSKFKTLWKTELTNRNDWLKLDGTYNYKILNKIHTALLQQAYQEEYTKPSSV